MIDQIGVVVVNYNGGDLTLDVPPQRARDRRGPHDRLEVVLVDNGSNDGVAGRVRASSRVVEVLANSAGTSASAPRCNVGIASLGRRRLRSRS